MRSAQANKQHNEHNESQHHQFQKLPSCHAAHSRHRSTPVNTQSFRIHHQKRAHMGLKPKGAQIASPTPHAEAPCPNTSEKPQARTSPHSTTPSPFTLHGLPSTHPSFPLCLPLPLSRSFPSIQLLHLFLLLIKPAPLFLGQS